MGSFCWGNVSAISAFTYNSYSTYKYKGAMTLYNTSTAIYTVPHPITNGIPTSIEPTSQNLPVGMELTTIPGSQIIATFSDPTTAPFIAVGTSGSARLVGFNAYVAVTYVGNLQNTAKLVCNSIYWCMGLI
jgi:hypothetical protein